MLLVYHLFYICVSIHAPLAGCDTAYAPRRCGRKCFNPRTPRGVRQGLHIHAVYVMEVSIHAPLAGCDSGYSRSRSSGRSFNPRTPRGVRLQQKQSPPARAMFQSTHPSRGATANGPTKGTFCHVFMGVTRHKYDFSRRFVPRPSFGTVLPPIFYHAIFCSLHLRAHKEPLR